MFWLSGVLLFAGLVNAVPSKRDLLDDYCKIDYATSKLSGVNVDDLNININPTVLGVSTTRGRTTGDHRFTRPFSVDYCNVTISYSHPGRNDFVRVQFWMPSIDHFQNRFVGTGGGGYYINSDGSFSPPAITNGAATAFTDGGFGTSQWSIKIDEITPISDGVPNVDAINMFGADAIRELMVIGKRFTQSWFHTTDRIFTYFTGCSEGGREALGLAMDSAPPVDGIVASAPVMRYSQAQLNHLFPMIVQDTLGYHWSPCEMNRISSFLVDQCDELDGRKDGIVARTELCAQQVNMSDAIGLRYKCPASKGDPDLEGELSAEAVQVATTMLDGLKDSSGNQIYWYLQPSSYFGDAVSRYDPSQDRFEEFITGNMIYGDTYYNRFMQELKSVSMNTVSNISYDRLAQMMSDGMDVQNGIMQVGDPDLSAFVRQGGKLILFSGEVDELIPAKAMTNYWESVREVLYSNETYEQGADQLNQNFRLYLVPGGTHCTPGNAQLGPWPRTSLEQIMDWVESDTVPETLQADVTKGDYNGETWNLCSYPLRPRWNGDNVTCEYDLTSINAFYKPLNYSNYRSAQVF